jgi:hypothetical protein
MQSPDHLERKRPSAIEHFVHAVSAADEGNEITRPKPVLVHVIFDRFHRVGEIEWIMLPLPGFHQRDEYIKPVAPGTVAFRRHQALDFQKDSAVITLGLDWCDVHGFNLQTVCAFIASYWRCVPMNRM